jgi:hypothetical protein
VSLERGPLSLMSTIERKSSGFGLESREYGRRGSAGLTTRHPSFPQKLALTSPTSSGRPFARVLSPRSLVFFSSLQHVRIGVILSGSMPRKLPISGCQPTGIHTLSGKDKVACNQDPTAHLYVGRDHRTCWLLCASRTFVADEFSFVLIYQLYSRMYGSL